MSGPSTYKPNSGFARWMDARLPVMRFAHDHIHTFPTPRNLNVWYTFGGILSFCLGIQIATGVVLAMHYTPDAGLAFNSVEHIMRDVNYGWLMRYLHSNGASMFFLAVYIHIFRGLYYGSYKAPREMIWILGVVLYILMMATAFLGYTLPWGQMSFWAATVITNLFGAIPYVGQGIVTWLWGGFGVDNATLHRFFSLHYLLPFVIAGVVVLHIWALHVPGNNNPLGIDVKGPQDTLPFHPYYTVKDAFYLSLFLIFYALFVFYAPNALVDPANAIAANPIVTPEHIVPEWYLLPFYAILRSIPNKLMGVLALFGALLTLFFVPWLDTSKVRSARFRPIYRQVFWFLVLDSVMLGYVGSQPVDANLLDTPIPLVWLGRLGTLYYFVHFWILMPLIGLTETLPSPGRPYGWQAMKERSLLGFVQDAFFHFLPLKRGGRTALAVRVGIGSLGPRHDPSARISSCAVLALGLLSGAALAADAPTGTPAAVTSEALAPKHLAWSFNQPFGTYDRASLQRGFQVYKEVCSACHSLNLVAIRTLGQPGGPGFSEAEVKAIAAGYMVPAGPNDQGQTVDDKGQPLMRPATPADDFPPPFANEQAARVANNGALPPDLSLIVKAREGHEDYIYSILTGFNGKPPQGFKMSAGMMYNPYFNGRQIAMPPPLTDDRVTYTDGTKATIDQEARDVVSFLAWAGEPKMEERKQMGLAVILFLALFSALLYFSYKRIWRTQH